MDCGVEMEGEGRGVVACILIIIYNLHNQVKKA